LAAFGIGGQPTPLLGDFAHRITESGILWPERFRHTLARLSVGSALFRRHGHDTALFVGRIPTAQRSGGHRLCRVRRQHYTRFVDTGFSTFVRDLIP
jgi:hypothetical protein